MKKLLNYAGLSLGIHLLWQGADKMLPGLGQFICGIIAIGCAVYFISQDEEVAK